MIYVQNKDGKYVRHNFWMALLILLFRRDQDGINWLLDYFDAEEVKITYKKTDKEIIKDLSKQLADAKEKLRKVEVVAKQHIKSIDEMEALDNSDIKDLAYGATCAFHNLSCLFLEIVEGKDNYKI